ncbi:hypothetical protein LTR53_004072 [Teratosphaeriaceae sp. CCFEE 6253]|nr:hypothetical protein LTR53_004072 [Teratosphaeriaceae sp. CCFEE 6253]
MPRPRVVALAAALVSLAAAQSSLTATQTYAPARSWTIPASAASCNQGSSPTTAPAGGVFQDMYGDFWAMNCDYSYSGTTYYDGSFVGTNSGGVYSCFNGCAKRVGCVAFTFYGTSSSGTAGTGRCYHFFSGNQGTLASAPGSTLPGSAVLYGSGTLVQQNPQTFMCPSNNDTYYTSAGGKFYRHLCGFDAGGGAGSCGGASGASVMNFPQCIANCEACGAGCGSVSYSYAGGEQASGNSGNCYYHLSGPANAVSPGTLEYASMVASIPPSSSTSSTQSTTTTTATTAPPSVTTTTTTLPITTTTTTTQPLTVRLVLAPSPRLTRS